VISADLSQVDARAVAAWCQDPAYLELFEPGRDSHTEIALAVWGDAGRRDDAKVLGHGYNYGMGLAKLAEKVGSDEVAREFDRSMKERFPGLVAWKRETAERADSGELLDNGFGRLLRTTPGYGWTQGPALLGQSAARDILMEGLLRLPAHILPMLRAVVHDEVVLSVPVDQVDEIERQVLDALQFEWAPRSGDQPVRIEAGLAKRGSTWGGCYRK
jgi:DNA polymerase-1